MSSISSAAVTKDVLLIIELARDSALIRDTWFGGGGDNADTEEDVGSGDAEGARFDTAMGGDCSSLVEVGRSADGNGDIWVGLSDTSGRGCEIAPICSVEILDAALVPRLCEGPNAGANELALLPRWCALLPTLSSKPGGGPKSGLLVLAAYAIASGP
jgi:hypothetical protein